MAANDDDGVLCTNLEGNAVSEEEPRPDLPKERQVEEEGDRKELVPCRSCGGTHLYTTVFTKDALCGDCMPPPSEDAAATIAADLQQKLNNNGGSSLSKKEEDGNGK